MVKLGLKRVNMQEVISVEVFLNSSATGLVISKFAKNHGFKLRKIEKLIYVRNVDRTFNKKGPIKSTVEVNTRGIKREQKLM